MGEPRERGILFSAPMVRALLEWRKTQTRRMLTPQPARGPTVGGDTMWRGGEAECPYGSPGDRLWVRETWGLSRDAGGDWLRFAAGGPPMRINDGRAPRHSFVDDGRRTWRPSIHMPRWASRITLELTEVRVQRLQQITEEEARAEGVERGGGGDWLCDGWKNYGPTELDGDHITYHTSARDSFISLWDSINGQREGASWKANPWCWALSFRRVTP